MRLRTSLVVAGLIGHIGVAHPQDAAPLPKIHLVWMGGEDCPPCVAWRRFELPKLRQSGEFQRIDFTYVIKGIGSPVPPRIFLPDEIKKYKEILDVAGAGRRGSPQVAVIVNGLVYDYFYGTRSAEDIEKMLLAIRTNVVYPFKRCLRPYPNSWSCEVSGT